MARGRKFVKRDYDVECSLSSDRTISCSLDCAVAIAAMGPAMGPGKACDPAPRISFTIASMGNGQVN
ncbi:hypothetical protein A0H81_07670 [Grifola frondosa]|uniref:Uncharacterized protein n=1 Tax=Grifola frondosa TaxID=5627 RepID=A0A1C7M546_GRIFR|nr:hypothetical protein A0H81_07670 [Grifola frondosa]